MGERRVWLGWVAGAAFLGGCGHASSGTPSLESGGGNAASAAGGSGTAGLAGTSGAAAGGRSNSAGAGGADHAGGTSSGSGAPSGGTAAAGASGGSTPSAGGPNGGTNQAASGSANGGASGDEGGGMTSGEAGEASGGAADGGRDLFTSSLVPHCDDGTYMNYELRGTLGSESVDLNESLSSTLDTDSLRVLAIEGSEVAEPLVLGWTATLGEETAVPLTGTSIEIPVGGQSYCITAGSFGSLTHTEGSPEPRKILFHITGLRLGDCSGPVVDADLGGCVSRDLSYFPEPGMLEIFPLDPSRPALPADESIPDLTDDEKASLCDWMALEEGGYGAVTACGAGSTANYTDQAQCLAASLDRACSTDTVGRVVICILAAAPTRHCDYPEECANMFHCGT
ncbi:MAG TPA: hypothetical protein VMI54_23220 [Polyangiaceae bacterium]|nr:hypothetical protein [Polyangiaceae bacterium]